MNTKYYFILIILATLVASGFSCGQQQDGLNVNEEVNQNVSNQNAGDQNINSQNVNTEKEEIIIPRGTVDPDFGVEVYEEDRVWPGTTLFADNHNQGSPRVVEVNMFGEIVWEYELPDNLKKYTNPGFDVEWLADDNILLMLPGKGVYEIDRDGNIVWSYQDSKVSHDADRLANGNTLFVYGGDDTKNDAQVKEVNHEGELIWSWYAKNYFNEPPYDDLYNGGWTHTNAVTRMKNGHTLISPRNFGCLVEYDPTEDTVSTIGKDFLVHAHDPEVLANGNILVANHDEPHEAIEFDPTTEEIVWRYTMSERNNWPVRDADRLPNGNTLITGTIKIIEVTTEGEVVWQFIVNNITNLSPINAGGVGFYKAERVGM